MPTIDWLYDRRSCMTCKKARGFLIHLDTTVTETIDATKVRYDESDALTVLSGIEKLIVAKGKKLEVFDLKHDRPTDETLLARLMGPTGNLRAPIVRIGKVLVVGFNEDAYKQVLGEA
jgi:arsenate reductase-like glutaredoxin family protein